MTVDIAVIGCGFMGRNHAHAVSDHPMLTLDSVADIATDSAESVAAEFGARRALTDYETAVENADAVVVATPEFAHAEQARMVLENDRHLLLEKPLTEDTNEAWALVDRATDRDVAAGVSFVLRYDPGYSGARQAVVDGEIGEPVGVSARRGLTSEESRRIGERGHPIYYMNIHDIDAMRWCVGSEVTRVRATERRGELDDIDVPDGMQALLEFEDGTIGTLAGYGILHPETPGGIDASLRIVGTAGTTIVDTPGTTLTVQGETYDRPDVRHWPVVNGRKDGAVRRQIDRFAKAAMGEEQLLASLEDGARAQAIADAIKLAAESDTPQDITYHY